MEPSKSDGAFRTIGEVSTELGVPQHILRYWETRFVQLRPVTRAGNRRYYRPDDVALVRRIDRALNRDGYTIKGVQKLLSAEPAQADSPETQTAGDSEILEALIQIRTELLSALSES